MAASNKPKSNKQLNLTELEQQLGELTAALQRERADAINVRRRAEEDRIKMASYFKASVIKELLPFMDNFDRALKHSPVFKDKLEQDWLQGLVSVKKQLDQTLESLGVMRIKTVGEAFDPKYHEAAQMDSSGQGSKEIVTEEFAPGYIMDGEVLRHSMVKVAMK